MMKVEGERRITRNGIGRDDLEVECNEEKEENGGREEGGNSGEGSVRKWRPKRETGWRGSNEGEENGGKGREGRGRRGEYGREGAEKG